MSDSARAVCHQAQLSDAALLQRLDAAIFHEACWTQAQWQGELRSASAIVLIACIADEPVGFIAAQAGGDEIDLHKVGVTPAYRRLGIAGDLLAALLYSGLYSKNRCLLDVSAKNAGALQFYEKHGFREIARRRRYYADQSDAVVMEKILSAPK